MLSRKGVQSPAPPGASMTTASTTLELTLKPTSPMLEPPPS
jgi:hypothetical protein